MEGIGGIPDAQAVDALLKVLRENGVSEFFYGDITIRFAEVREPQAPLPNPMRTLDEVTKEHFTLAQDRPIRDFRENPALWPGGEPPQYESPFSREPDGEPE